MPQLKFRDLVATESSCPYHVDMKRSKKYKIALQERVRILAATEGVVINSDGKRLKPGTPEYLQQLEKFVTHLGDEEFRDFVAHGKVKGQ